LNPRLQGNPLPPPQGKKKKKEFRHFEALNYVPRGVNLIDSLSAFALKDLLGLVIDPLFTTKKREVSRSNMNK